MGTSLIQLVFNGLNYGFIYGLLALSINIIYSATNIVNFAQGDLMMLGLMLSVTFYTSGMLPFPLAALVILSIMVLIGILEYQLLIKRLVRKKAHMIIIIITTLGFSIVLRALASMFWGKEQQFAKPPFGSKSIYVFGEGILPQSFFIYGITLVCLAVIWYMYNRTLFGLAIRATAFNRDCAKLTGINVESIVKIAFGLSAALAGLAGILYGPISYASPWLGLSFSINGFAAAIVGGLGSWPGAVIGGLILAVFVQIATLILGPDLGEGLTVVLILLILYLKPSGILGDPLAQEGADK